MFRALPLLIAAIAASFVLPAPASAQYYAEGAPYRQGNYDGEYVEEEGWFGDEDDYYDESFEDRYGERYYDDDYYEDDGWFEFDDGDYYGSYYTSTNEDEAAWWDWW